MQRCEALAHKRDTQCKHPGNGTGRVAVAVPCHACYACAMTLIMSGLAWVLLGAWTSPQGYTRAGRRRRLVPCKKHIGWRMAHFVPPSRRPTPSDHSESLPAASPCLFVCLFVLILDCLLIVNLSKRRKTFKNTKDTQISGTSSPGA